VWQLAHSRTGASRRAREVDGEYSPDHSLDHSQDETRQPRAGKCGTEFKFQATAGLPAGPSGHESRDSVPTVAEAKGASQGWSDCKTRVLGLSHTQGPTAWAVTADSTEADATRQTSNLFTKGKTGKMLIKNALGCRAARHRLCFVWYVHPCKTPVVDRPLWYRTQTVR
jgi:hypothetical protein